MAGVFGLGARGQLLLERGGGDLIVQALERTDGDGQAEAFGSRQGDTLADCFVGDALQQPLCDLVDLTWGEAGEGPWFSWCFESYFDFHSFFGLNCLV
jgi:hypothetical protein